MLAMSCPVGLVVAMLHSGVARVPPPAHLVLRCRPLEVGLTVFPESNTVVFLGSLLLQLVNSMDHYCFAGTHRQPRYLRGGTSDLH